MFLNSDVREPDEVPRLDSEFFLAYGPENEEARKLGNATRSVILLSWFPHFVLSCTRLKGEPMLVGHCGLTKGQKLGLVVFFLAWFVFGLFVEMRGALLRRPMGDLGVYLRAAWTVRSGADLYDTTVTQKWHYCYPPLLAIFMTPLADPPAGADRHGMLPYSVSVAIWYGFSLVCLFGAVHILARTLERARVDSTAEPAHPWSRAWWAFRVVPILVCIIPIGHTLMRGQVNLLVLLLLCGMLAAVLQGRSLQAGLWLAGAICIKIFPAYLLIYPLWRRDGRFLAGCLAGLFVGLVLIPTAVFGPARAFEYARRLNTILVLPALGMGTDSPLAEELINVTATDSQSILATVHNTLNLNPDMRPKQASSEVRVFSLVAGVLLTVEALVAGGRRRKSAAGETVFVGMLIVNMLLLNPVCHLHYFCFAGPLVMGLVARVWQRDGQLGRGLTWLLAVYAIANFPPQIPGLELLRDCGLAMYAALALWSAGFIFLCRHAPFSSAGEIDGSVRAAA
jgi:hypothetical protein